MEIGREVAISYTISRDVAHELTAHSQAAKLPDKFFADLLAHEDVPAFVELQSGGPPPGACQVVGVGQPPSYPTKERGPP